MLICVCVVLPSNVLTVKRNRGVDCDHGHVLRGAHFRNCRHAGGPGARARPGAARADRDRPRGDRARSSRPDSRRGRPRGVRRGGAGRRRRLRRPGRRTPRARPPRCSPPAPAWRATRACAAPSTSSSRRRPAAEAAVDAAVEFFAGLFAAQGGLMAERVTDLRDIGRRVTAHVVGEPEPGVPTPERALGAGRRGPRAVRHRGPRPGLRASPWSPRRAAPPATPRSSPASSASRASSACAGALDLPTATSCSSTGVTGEVEIEPDEAAAAERVGRRPRGARASSTPGPGRPTTSDGTPVKLLANVADAASAAKAATAPVEGVGLFRTELCFLDQQGGAERRGAGGDLRRRALAVRRRPLRRGAHPRRRLRQADRLRDQGGRGEPRPRRARPPAEPSTTPGCSTGSSTASPSPRRRPAPSRG